MSESQFDSKQSASAAQFDRQSDRYGKSHILADTQDVAAALEGLAASAGATALDVATGGGHTALWLARHGWKVTAGDIAHRGSLTSSILGIAVIRATVTERIERNAIQ